MDDIYQARFGWTTQTTRVVASALVFLAVTALPGFPLWFAVVVYVLFGGGTIFFLIRTLSGALALRVDERGVTIGRLPGLNGTTTWEVPWDNITAVVLFEQVLMSSPLRRKPLAMGYVGLQLRERPVDGIPGGQGRFARTVSGPTLRHVPASVVAGSLAISGWRLDRERLDRAVAAFAPGVRVVDLGG